MKKPESKTSSKSGTRTTNKKFTKKEVCEIISLCAASGVGYFKYENLELSYVKPEQVFKSNSPDKEISEEQHKNQTKDSIENDEVTLMEDRIGQMFIEDPVQAEKLIMDGELEDAEPEPDEL